MPLDSEAAETSFGPVALRSHVRMGHRGVAASQLLERDWELAVARRALKRAAAGAGGVLAVECDRGMGKTALLDAVAADASARGFTVLRARGIEAERLLAFGVVRQLLGRLEDASVLAAAPAAARGVLATVPAPAAERRDPFPAFFGLYSVCAGLAERAPILLVIDDAESGDEASLRFVAFLRERLDGLRAAVVLGSRPPSRGARDVLSARIAGDPRTIRLAPRTLTEDAVSTLVRRRLRDAPEDLCRACAQVTGGNPFYVQHLVRELRTGVDLGPDDVFALAPEAVIRAVLTRIGSIGADAVATARAVAVLRADAELRLVAEVADVPVARAAMAVDALVDGGLLADVRPLAFRHPIVRTVVEADLPTGVRGLEHRRAARVLIDAGAPAERVALQVLATEPAGDAWVVDALESGAAAAVASRRRETAVALLRRALAEPPSAERRGAILGALGAAERHVMAPQASCRLHEARAAAVDDERRLALTLELAAAREQRGQPADALPLLEHELARLCAQGGDADAAQVAHVEAQLLAARLGALLPIRPEDRARAHDRLARLHPAVLEARLLAGVLACDEVMHRRSAATAARLAGLALADDLPPRALESPVAFLSMPAAVAAGRPELVLSSVDLPALAATTGSPWAVAAASTWWALAAHNCGALGEAEAAAGGAMKALADLPVGLVAAAGILGDILLDRRGREPAAHAVERGTGVAPPRPVLQTLIFDGARARVALAHHDTAAAASAARQCAALLEAAAMDAPALVPWRRDLALAQFAAVDGPGARDAARAQLAAAQAFGERGAIADALVTLGHVQSGEAGLRMLRDAADEALASGRPIVQIRALGALGAAIRRTGQLRDAREPLSAALGLAEDCGALALGDRLRDELQAAGVRPRRRADDRVRGELTPSELRVCRLAAEDMTNRDIAQTLFVSVKTVETHLRAAFRKLDIDSRRHLAGALERRAGHVPERAGIRARA